MTVSKLVPLAAVLALLAVATQANAAPLNHQQQGYAHNDTSTVDSTYRDPTTRGALLDGAW